METIRSIHPFLLQSVSFFFSQGRLDKRACFHPTSNEQTYPPLCGFPSGIKNPAVSFYRSNNTDHGLNEYSGSSYNGNVETHWTRDRVAFAYW